MTPAPLPDGFVVRRRGAATLLVDAALADALCAAELDTPDGWRRRLGADAKGAGRGATAVLDVAPGRRIRIKALRRGGLVATLWRDTFVGRRRLLDNLSVPLAAVARGVATPRPRALLLLPGLPGLTRGWLAVDEIEGARDLAARLGAGADVSTAMLAAAVAAIRRMHDAGVEHRDLNLGNLVTAGADESPVAAVLDLDRARLHDGPLPAALRLRGILRLERSHHKLRSRRLPGAVALDPSIWGTAYAGDDPDLARRLEVVRRRGRPLLALHRLGWG